MDTNKSEQELYQIYFDGNDYCAELIDGSWRVVVPDSELFNCGKEFDQKPERFVKSELLTLDEIYLIGIYRNLSSIFMNLVLSLKEPQQYWKL